MEQVQLELDAHPAYSHAFSLKTGTSSDCSGMLARVFIKAGIPVKRTTAARMYEGLDGWAIKAELEFENGKKCSIIVWTMQDNRPHGHVGIEIEDTYKKVALWFAHAGSGGFAKGKMYKFFNEDGSLEDDYFHKRLDKIFEVEGVE